MKKITMTIAAISLTAAGIFAVATQANAQGGWWHGHNGYSSNMTPAAQANMQKHHAKTAPLSQALYAKQAELDQKITSGADAESIQTLTNEINDLNASLNQAQVELRQQMASEGSYYAGHMASGYGHHGGTGHNW